MLIKKFRGKEFVDREKEIKFLMDWFEKVADEILWLYGPKSCGKTTLIEYVIENELLKNSQNKYWIKYINFRGLMVSSYDTFIDSFFEEAENEKDLEMTAGINLGVICIEGKALQKIKERKKNLFNELIERFKKIERQKFLIIDEIQILEEIYINGDKQLLKEFLNFCVRLTKELHLCHVAILSSNTEFINQIYNEAKLKVTSEFKKIDHMDKNTTYEYLKAKGFSDEETALIWDYIGGCMPRLQKMMRKKEEFKSLKDYLEREMELAKLEVKFFMLKKCTHKEIEVFLKTIKKIVIEKVYILSEKDIEKDVLLSVVEKFAQVEILFFDPRTLRVTGNNRLYEKAFEKMIQN